METMRKVNVKFVSVRGVLKPGYVTAILGGSGAGKSSLMTAIAYRTARELIELNNIYNS